MMSPRRQERIVRARQVAMYLAINLIDDWSLPRIARRFHKDHTTVMHARDRIEEMRNSRPDIADRVLRLEAELTRGPA
jgi:chromosomal replication initiator protein